MQKAAPLIISSESNLTHSCRHHEAFLAKQNKMGEVMTKWVCLVHQEAFLSKQHLLGECRTLWGEQAVMNC